MHIPLFDAHCDTALNIIVHNQKLRQNTLHVDLERLHTYTPSAQVFAIWARPDGEPTENFDRDYPRDVLYALYQKHISRLLIEFSENEDILRLCYNASQAKKAAQDGKIAAFIAIEGAELIGCSIKALREAFRLGARFINITWNYDNALSGSAMGPTKSGLTDEGRRFIAAAQELHIAVDMSHISERAFWDTLEIAKRPVLAGHSNSIKLCPHPRNLTDDQFVALAKRNGVAGLNLCPDFLGDNADVTTCVAHIEHFLALGGEKAVCIGGDLDGIEDTPKPIRGVQDVGLIYEELLRRNYNEELVRDVFYNNLMSFIERTL